MITFAERYRNGQRPDILDEIDAWHDSPGDLELHEYLGLTWEQYARWVQDPTSLKEMLSGLEETQE